MNCQYGLNHSPIISLVTFLALEGHIPSEKTKIKQTRSMGKFIRTYFVFVFCIQHISMQENSLKQILSILKMCENKSSLGEMSQKKESNRRNLAGRPQSISLL